MTKQWVKARINLAYEGDESGPLSNTSERAGLPDATKAVRKVFDQTPDIIEPGGFANAFFPGVAIAVTVICILLSLAGVLGPRRSVVTTIARIALPVAVVAAIALTVLAYFNLGFALGSDKVDPPPVVGGDGQSASEAPPLAYFYASVRPESGPYWWVAGLVLLAAAVIVGPRKTIQRRTSDPARYPHLATGQYPGQFEPGQYAPGEYAPGHQGQGFPPPGYPPRPVAARPAVVIAGIAALLCFAGYAFLSWTDTSQTVTFSDLGKAARDGGFGSGKIFAEVYFAGLGWLFLLAAIGIAVALYLGHTGALDPLRWRRRLGITVTVALAFHVVAMVQLDADGFGIGVFAVTAGLIALVVAAWLPPRPGYPQGAGAIR